MSKNTFIISLRDRHFREENIISFEEKDDAIEYCELYAQQFQHHGLTKIEGEDAWANTRYTLVITPLELHSKSVYKNKKPKYKVGNVITCSDLLNGEGVIKKFSILPPTSYQYLVNGIWIREDRIKNKKK